jgi:DNA-binding NarL/FixJ family response regulator
MTLAAPALRSPARGLRLPARAKTTACVSILIATPDEVLQDGLRATFRDAPALGVIGTAGNGLAAIASAERRRPDLALIDQRLAAPSGVETAAAIMRNSPHCRVLLYLDSPDAQVMRRAWSAGVTSYLLKGASQETLREAARLVAAGADYVDPQLTETMREIQSNPLSDRELEVLELVSHGLSNNVVAIRLEISEETVKSHVTKILGKLEAGCRAHAVALAIRTGVIE